MIAIDGCPCTILHICDDIECIRRRYRAIRFNRSVRGHLKSPPGMPSSVPPINHGLPSRQGRRQWILYRRQNYQPWRAHIRRRCRKPLLFSTRSNAFLYLADVAGGMGRHLGVFSCTMLMYVLSSYPSAYTNGSIPALVA